MRLARGWRNAFRRNRIVAPIVGLTVAAHAAEPRTPPPSPLAITVQTGARGVPASPNLFGVFFEEINHAGDGGLYAELVRNRTFKERDAHGLPIAWSVVSGRGSAGATIALDSRRPLNAANTEALRVDVSAALPEGRVGVANTGYWGIPVRRGAAYRLALHMRGSGLPLTATLEGAKGQIYARANLGSATDGWTQKTVRLVAAADNPAARLVIATTRPGRYWLNVVSLFPEKTFRDRPNGLRPDLAEKVAALRPAFLRFPGGCYVEGGDLLANRFRWKTTVTDIATRPGHNNDIWHYWSTDGLGYHEYLQMCEDMHTAPMFVVNCGMSHKELVPMDQLEPYVQDALDAIEYANGPVASKWGALRTKNGHPAPFGLKYVEIGNENGLWQGFGGTRADYTPRYHRFYDAIKARYPGIVTIANTRVDAPMEMVDDHNYNSPGWFWENTHFYDKADRKGPKIYLGEYATTTDAGKGNLRAALADAAWMTGLERNSDIVTMASYAPLFVNIHDRAWNPDAIGFDASHSFGTPSYYVQQLFAENRVTKVLPITFPNPARPVRSRGGIGLGTWATQAEFKDITVTMPDGATAYASNFAQDTANWRAQSGHWSVVDGAYQQSAGDTDRRALLELPALTQATDYTVSLKARKLGGDEGFLVLFHAPNTDNYYWWNVGGWGNTLSVIEKSVGGVKNPLGPRVPLHLETGRWYSVRIALEGSHIRCYLDDKLLADVEDTAAPLLAADAGKAPDGSLILKFVNGTEAPVPARIDLAGAGRIASTGVVTTLTSAALIDENSLDVPKRVAPVRRPLSGITPTFSYTFPPRSLTVVRVPAQ